MNVGSSESDGHILLQFPPYERYRYTANSIEYRKRIFIAVV